MFIQNKAAKLLKYTHRKHILTHPSDIRQQPTFSGMGANKGDENLELDTAFL